MSVTQSIYEKCANISSDRACINAGCTVNCQIYFWNGPRLARCISPALLNSSSTENLAIEPTTFIAPTSTSYLFLIPLIFTSVYFLLLLCGLLLRLIKRPSLPWDSRYKRETTKTEFKYSMAVEDNYNYVCFNGISKRLRFWHLGLFFSDLSTVFGMTFLTLGYCLVYFNQDDACLYTSTIGNIPKEYFIAGLTFIAVGKLRVIFVLIYGGRLKHLESLPKCVAKIQSLPPEITLTRHYFISSAIDEFNLTPLISSSEDTSHFDVNEIDPSKFGLIILGTTASVEFDDRSLLDELKAQYFRTSPPRSDVRVHYKIQGYSAGEILCHSGARKPWYLYREFYLFVTIIGLGYVHEMWLEWITKEVDLDFKKLVTLQNGKPYDLIRSKKTYNEIME